MRMKRERPPAPGSARRRAGLLSIPVLLMLASCGSSSGDDSAASSTADDVASTVGTTDDGSVDTADPTDSTVADTEATTSVADGVDIGLFFDGALADEVTTEDCTLNGGAETTCYSITVSGSPASHDVGPFCPDTITDSADAGGIWFDGDAVYDLDGEFFVDLPTIYSDDNWQMYDEDGNIMVTETAEEFEAAARPDVDPALQNHCIQGSFDFLDNGEAITSTVLIPTAPVAANGAAATSGTQGVTLDGVVIAESAPVNAILGAYTIAAFDNCGAHFNPFEGYHMHGAVGCSEVTGDDLPEGETPQFGYAMDGYPLHSPLEDGSDVALDECNGHETDELGYHYHANSAEQNQVVECLIGQTVAGAEGFVGGGRPDDPPLGDG